MTTHPHAMSTPTAAADTSPQPVLTVVSADAALAQIDGHRPACMDVIRQAYLAHDGGTTMLPHSTFVRPDPARLDRFIALPGYLGGTDPVAGMKWIASYPDNVASRLHRASAVLVLNDTRTGYPFAVVEGSVISATRTAASAILAAEQLLGRRQAARVGIVGTGLIATHVYLFLRDLDWDVAGYIVRDTSRERASHFKNTLLASGAVAVRVANSYEELFAECDLIVLATTASTPYLLDPALLANAPVVLHLSLRDLGPEVIEASQNLTDDAEHAVRERTSLHLAQQKFGPHVNVVDGTIADVLTGRLARDGRPVVFAPFGLGILDLALGRWVYERCRDEDTLITLHGFFPVADHRQGR